jgi:hypothetical protein
MNFVVYCCISILLIKQNPIRGLFKLFILTCTLATSSTNISLRIIITVHPLCCANRDNAQAIHSYIHRYPRVRDSLVEIGALASVCKGLLYRFWNRCNASGTKASPL